MIKAATLPQDESRFAISNSSQSLNQPGLALSQEFVDSCRTHSRQLTDNGAKLDVLGRNNHQMNMFGHYHETKQPETVLAADFKEAIDNKILENVVGQCRHSLVSAERHESGTIIMIIMLQPHLPEKIESWRRAINQKPTRRFALGGVRVGADVDICRPQSSMPRIRTRRDAETFAALHRTDQNLRKADRALERSESLVLSSSERA